MKKDAIAAAILLAGCPSTPGHYGIKLAPVAEVPGQARALHAMQDAAAAKYGRQLDVADSAKVFWTDTICPGTDDAAVIYNGRCYHGLTFSCARIYVAINEKEPSDLCATELVHEFGHCVLLTLFGQGDPGHQMIEFWELERAAKEAIGCP